MDQPQAHRYARPLHPWRRRVLALIGKTMFAVSAALMLQDLLFPQSDFFAGTYAQLTNRAAASRNHGEHSDAVPSRMGAKRYYDRGNAPPLTSLAASAAQAWTGGALQCPSGRYQAELVPPNDRLGIETPLLEPRNSCEKCPRGRFGASAGLTSPDACTSCPSGRFGVRSGSASVEDACALCPAGTFGSERGLTTPACSGDCPAGTFRTPSYHYTPQPYIYNRIFLCSAHFAYPLAVAR